MAITGKPLAEGQIGSTSQTIVYTVGSSPAGVNGGQLMLFNTSSTGQTITIAYKFVSLSSSTIRSFGVLTLNQNENAIVDLPDLAAGDIVYITTTTANVLNWVLYGGLISA